ncbi:MAG: hypothetical protein ACLRMN_04105 [Mediterraneibacter gnavus]
MKKKGKKGLAVAMTLAVTMTSVPTAFATWRICLREDILCKLER